ncbi:MAG TPA: molybdopterin-dependent oxidoreductase, partial [Spirochaetia bacterium]|nr:molybdopterin-dependent oxidoreductase [Spirochaetia bacterium]
KGPIRRIPVSCNRDCGGGCPLLAHVAGDHLEKITANPLAGPYMSGCIRGFQMPRVVYASGRLKEPMVRTGARGSGQFRAVSWAEALDHVASKLAEIRDRCGPRSILRLGGSGAVRGALHNTSLLTRRFLKGLGGFTDTLGSFSAAAVDFVTPFLFGTNNTGLDPATLRFSRLIILWGANVSDTRLGCELENRIREQTERGTPVVVIDPRRSRSVRRLGGEWIPILPGTDSALMSAVLWVLIKENLVDREFIRRTSIGFEALERSILGLEGGPPRTPQWAERICGTPPETIENLARRYARSRPAALIPGLSIQRTLGGEEAFRLAAALQAATGNTGRPGGSSGGSIWNRLPRPRCGSLRAEANPVGVPVYLWPDAVLERRKGNDPGDIRCIYNVGGNYLSQGSDIHKNIRAFNKVEFSVCHDFFLTPTARFCDVVLPVTTFLEREDILFSGANYLLFSNRAIDPLPNVRNDYDIFCGLAERLGFLHEFSEGKSAADWIDGFLRESEVPDLEEFKRTGIHMGGDQERVGLADFVADPEAHPLATPSGRIELYSKEYGKTGFSPVPECRIEQPGGEYPLRLITPHVRYRINSQNFNVEWFNDREDQTLWMNPRDASERGLSGEQKVLVSSPNGMVRVPVRVTGDIMPGVVSLNQGAWPEFGEDGVEIRGAANTLSSTEPTKPSQGSRTHSIFVQVSA